MINKINIADEKKPFTSYDLVELGDPYPDIKDSPIIIPDLETGPKNKYIKHEKAALDLNKSQICGIAIAVPGKAWYLPIRHKNYEKNLDIHTTHQWLKDTLNHKPEEKVIINHHLKFDLKLLKKAGVDVSPASELFCTIVGETLINENQNRKIGGTGFGLKALAAKHLGMPNEEEKEVQAYLNASGIKKNFLDYSIVPPDKLGMYACGDVERAYRLACRQKRILDEDNLQKVWSVERKLTHLLIDMECRGIKVDILQLKLDKIEYIKEILELEKTIERLTGAIFNPNSGKDLEEILIGTFNVEVIKRGKPSDDNPLGDPSFDDDTLKSYMSMYPELSEIFWNIRKIRRLEHMLSNFVDPYLKYEHDGILHCTHNQTRTVTGRMSCSDPNLQQIAKPDVWNWKNSNDTVLDSWKAPGARHYFIPRKGKTLLIKDYSQIQYRLFVHYTQSERLINAYVKDKNLDFHRWVSEDILENMLIRDKAKHINFGCLFGIGKKKLVKSLQHFGGEEISLLKAESILQKYFEEIPELNALKKKVENTLKSRGYLRSVLGRRRRGNTNPYAYRKDQNPNGLLPYQGVNSLCQSSEADLVKTKMVEAGQVHGILKGTDGYLLLQEHDEVVGEVPSGQEKEYNDPLTTVMEDFRDEQGKEYIRVPIYVGSDFVTTNWSEKKGMNESSNRENTRSVLY